MNHSNDHPENDNLTPTPSASHTFSARARVSGAKKHFLRGYSATSSTVRDGPVTLPLSLWPGSRKAELLFIRVHALIPFRIEISHFV